MTTLASWLGPMIRSMFSGTPWKHCKQYRFAYADFVILGLAQWSASVDGLQNYLHLKWIVAAVLSLFITCVPTSGNSRASMAPSLLGVDLEPNCTTFFGWRGVVLVLSLVCIGCRPQEHAHLIFYLWRD